MSSDGQARASEPAAPAGPQPVKKDRSGLGWRFISAGVLIPISGLHGNVLRLQPPLCISADQIDHFVATLGRVLDEVAA